MIPFVMLVLMVGAIGGLAWRFRFARAQSIARDRFAAPPDDADAAPIRRRNLRPVIGRFYWISLVAGILAALVLYVLVGASLVISTTIGIIAALLTFMLEIQIAEFRRAKLETQLAEAIDLMVGALGAGAGVNTAMGVALEETRDPLRTLLRDVIERIRYGDDPEVVFQDVSSRVPMETFLLFSSALAVHWDVGGSLAPTMASVGRTIRDRIEIARQIRSNIAQSNISTVAIIGLTYFIAAVMWRNSPEQTFEFVASPTGEFFVAGSMLLQAVGIVWMYLMSRAKF
ncbi:type II secretion system F family protein [Blastopirellula marina]|nr:type II secretion system F family protein [Blastopirellula marina]